MRELTLEGVERRYPAYIISPRRKQIPIADPRIKLLLSETIEATSLAVGGRNHFGCSRLHIKTDSVEGVGIDGVRVANPYDVVGGIGGSREFKEIIYANSGSFGARVTLGSKETKSINVRLNSTELGTPTLIVGRRDIESPGIAPDLIDAKEADPYFGPVQLIQLNFGEMVKRVIKNLPPERYIFVD